MKFSKGKCEVLPLERNNHVHLHKLQADQLESSFTEKSLRVSAETKMNMRQQMQHCG